MASRRQHIRAEPDPPVEIESGARTARSAVPIVSSVRKRKVPFGWRALAAVLLLGLLVAVTWSEILLRNRVEELTNTIARLEQVQAEYDGPLTVSPLLLNYQLDLPGRGEVFPAMAAGGASDYWPLAILRITNTGNRPSAQTITAEVPGWSRPMVKSVVVGAQSGAQLQIQPDLLPAAYGNEEIRNAALTVKAVGPDETVLFAESRPVLIHGGSEIYWGQKFSNAQVTARWVTPHDPSVLELVSKARQFARRGRMAGYSGATGDSVAIARHVVDQATAVFQAMRNSGISYVNSLFVMGSYVGEAQRVRLPSETLRLNVANCMDVSVVFASAMENLGMQPLLILGPGHAIAGVRVGHDAQDILYLDLTVLPDGSFSRAEQRGRSWMKKTRDEEELVVDVAASRVLGIYPLENPSPVLRAE